MQRRDYLERMIEQLAAAIAQAIGLARAQRAEEAEQVLADAWTSGLGFRRADAARLDDTTLRMLLGAKAEQAAALFDAEAEIAEARGDSSAAARGRLRATAMRGRS
jgi:hypothetical protein